MNHYDVLGLDASCGKEDITLAYRKLSQKFHPDKNNGDRFFEGMFKRINMAYQTLSDPELRKQYDASLKTEEQQSDNFVKPIDGADLVRLMERSMEVIKLNEKAQYAEMALLQHNAQRSIISLEGKAFLVGLAILAFLGIYLSNNPVYTTSNNKDRGSPNAVAPPMEKEQHQSTTNTSLMEKSNYSLQASKASDRSETQQTTSKSALCSTLSEPHYVIAENLNVREGPSTRYPVLTVIPQNFIVYLSPSTTYPSTKNTWMKVCFYREEKITEGWINSNLIGTRQVQENSDFDKRNPE